MNYVTLLEGEQVMKSVTIRVNKNYFLSGKRDKRTEGGLKMEIFA